MLLKVSLLNWTPPMLRTATAIERGLINWPELGSLSTLFSLSEASSGERCDSAVDQRLTVGRTWPARDADLHHL